MLSDHVLAPLHQTSLRRIGKAVSLVELGKKKGKHVLAN